MRTQKIPRSRKLGFNMIPMIDVVFLLIIFFLVTNNFARNENKKLDLSHAESGETEVNLNDPRLTINVLEGGEMSLAGRPLTRESLPSRLVEAREQHGDAIEVRIRCSKQTPYNQVAPIMLACIKSGVWNVTFAVYRPETGR